MTTFLIGQIFDKGISLHCGQARVQACIDELIAWLDAGASPPRRHHHPSPGPEEASKGYELFNNKEDGCVKVVLTP